MELIANVFSFLGHTMDMVVGYKYNEKAKIILFGILSSLCSLIAMFLLHSLAGCISVVVTMIRLYVIYLKDKNNWKIDWITILFVLGYGFVFLDNDVLVAFLLFVGNVVAFLPRWFCQNVQYIRIGACMANIIIIFPHYLIHNYSGMFFHVVNVITILLSYYKWYRVEKC